MGNLAEDISLVGKKSQFQLWTAVIVSCCSFFLMVKGILSSYKCTAFLVGRRFAPIVMDRKCVCTPSLCPTSHSTVLFHFGGSSGNSEIAYGRDPCHLQAEGTRGGDVSPRSCFQGKYYLHWSSPPTAS